MLRKILMSAAAVATLTLGFSGTARAQSPTDNSVFFTFNQPVTLPHLTLPAGRYLFQLAGSMSNRSIVEVFSEDRSKLYSTFLTVPSEQGQDQPSRVPGNTGVRFMETAANVPPAIRSWWYPGRQLGWEFVYPKAQAMTLAKTAKEPVLATASNDATTADEMKNDQVERISSSGQETPVANDTNVAASAAANTTPTPAPVTQEARNETRTALPKTASDEPLVALTGVLLLAAGFGLGLTRRTAR